MATGVPENFNGRLTPAKLLQIQKERADSMFAEIAIDSLKNAQSDCPAYSSAVAMADSDRLLFSKTVQSKSVTSCFY
jgi:hypothetical protein